MVQIHVRQANLLGKKVYTFTYIIQAIYKLTIYFTQRMYHYNSIMQYVQYNTINRYTYLIMQGTNFSLHSTYTGVQCLWTPKHAYVFSIFKTHMPAVPNLWTGLIQSYKMHGFVFCPYLPRHYVRSFSRYTRSYTNIPGLVSNAAERKCGATSHCALKTAFTPFENLLCKTGTHERQNFSRAGETDLWQFTLTHNPNIRYEFFSTWYHTKKIHNHILTSFFVIATYSMR